MASEDLESPPPAPGDDEPMARPPRLRGWGGCLLWAGAFLFVIVAGCSVGLVLRPDPDGGDTATTAASGEGWSLRVRTDEQDDPCVELFADDTLATAQCGYLLGGTEGEYRASSVRLGDGTVIIFGPVPADVTQVRLRLADDSRPTVDVQETNGIRFFVRDGDVADQGPTELLDADGNAVEAPA